MGRGVVGEGRSGRKLLYFVIFSASVQSSFNRISSFVNRDPRNVQRANIRMFSYWCHPIEVFPYACLNLSPSSLSVFLISHFFLPFFPLLKFFQIQQTDRMQFLWLAFLDSASRLNKDYGNRCLTLFFVLILLNIKYIKLNLQTKATF